MPIRNTHQPLSPSIRGGLLFSMLLFAPPEIWASGPSVGELLKVCDRAFAQGYQGLDAATCEWFTAAPCACKLRDPDDGTSPWCVPDSETIDDTVRKVIAALRRGPNESAPAELAVQDILTELYPCASAEGR